MRSVHLDWLIDTITTAGNFILSFDCIAWMWSTFCAWCRTPFRSIYDARTSFHRICPVEYDLLFIRRLPIAEEDIHEDVMMG